MRPAILDEIPHVELLGSENGDGDWHENAEVARLVRPMTADEWADHQSYDRTLYRAREASLAHLRRLYGDQWMLTPSRAARGEALHVG